MVKLIEKAANLLRKQSVELFDIFLVESRGTAVEVKKGSVEKIRRSQKVGLAIRAVVEGRLGFAYTNDVSEEGIRIAIECAKENALYTSQDEYTFSMPQQAPDFDFPLADSAYNEIPITRKIELAAEVEERVLNYDPRVKRVRKASYADALSTVFYYNSNDHSFTYTTTNFSLSVLAAAEENGDSQIGWDYQSKRFFSELNPVEVAVNAADGAVELLGARPITSMKVPVIFKNAVFAELIETLSAGFLGTNVLRKKSLFAEKLGHEIASSALSIYDDPFQREGTGSAPFDDEGVATRKKAVVERGVLKNFLTDLYSAKKLGLPATGNGMRSSVGALPTSGITNLVVERGALGLEELVKTPEKVLVVTDAMGIHTINPISGEFSIGISGVFFKDGNRVTPVTGMTVAGNVNELLKGITQVGADLKWLGNVCSPSVLIKELTVSGE
ncbi:TldD/PmbA family protein [Thermovibrio ammonificans]|jgi:PmbA protein|uniref:Peptidase U62 modulator of DNA gyrase n=1 Tax=Thermovibrio ammonificans (strain DSM 15698 / JCM 12110 / HB-1) TaxID=648996 RepID=E8T6F5_THEA1|nr:TldD/PmbA family protein [Thermovibrio ammonificans]ADU96739.1 peptidase U62 modulator of DNA gyrase [Thermovibrio ammonificans HB-1]